MELNSSFLSRYLLTGLVAGTAVGTVIGYAIASLTRRKSKRIAIDDASAALERALATMEGGMHHHEPKRVRRDGTDANAHAKEEEEAMREQLIRNYQFFGEEGQSKVRGSFVVVIGLGGVGSHCAVSLARSGVGHIRIVDFDRVSLSSLNRHACATRREVGLSKTEAIRRCIHAISPHTKVDARETLFELSQAESLLEGRPDYVVDCIDNVPTKVDLIAYCVEHSLPLISACGSACKADPTKLRIDDIENTVEDDLARAVRVRLRQRGIERGVMVCYSTERTERALLPLRDYQEDNPADFVPLPNFRVRILPVIGPLPAIMGQSIAVFVLTSLADQPIGQAGAPAAAEWQIRRKNYRKLFTAVKTAVISETNDRSAANAAELPFDASSCLYVDVYGGKCAITRQTGVVGTLEFVPWLFERGRIRESVSAEKMVLCSAPEARRHLSEGGTDDRNQQLWGPETTQHVQQLIDKARDALSKLKSQSQLMSDSDGVVVERERDFASERVGGGQKRSERERRRREMEEEEDGCIHEGGWDALWEDE
ncbi:unnamed protein product [Vitrella brassicaformis CCMP3155]|uniref:THIF-type NAD/FAD binding fold domain-containing protein n=1 Tax=Vitrella brassicaformis (strain CCMP3155) TaxID=1169540 RepID=A0A0G4EHM3_VITBC|nr:unnamed protein product [Vitrella brassicaformis CCMP3155]|eukprot:CEL95685.1 unnamed protein product [Vitrella brassicaformis CCMP3155]